MLTVPNLMHQNSNTDLIEEGAATGDILSQVAGFDNSSVDMNNKNGTTNANVSIENDPLGQTLWRFRLTDSDFFQQYQEEQRRMKEEIERQRALMKAPKLKPYKPEVKVTSKEEI